MMVAHLVKFRSAERYSEGVWQVALMATFLWDYDMLMQVSIPFHQLLEITSGSIVNTTTKLKRLTFMQCFSSYRVEIIL